MEVFYIFENYLVNENLFTDREFTNKLINLLTEKISEEKIKGAFYTHYSQPFRPHIRIGLWKCNSTESDIEKIKGAVSNIISDNLFRQSDIRQEPIFLPTEINNTTNTIACYSFGLLKFVRNKSNSEISELYFKVFSKFITELNVNKAEALINFGEFKTQYPNYFLKQFNLTDINLTNDYNNISDLCSEICTWLKNNVHNYNNIWFLCDRFFHHCNNSNNKFGSEESEILDKFMRCVNVQ